MKKILIASTALTLLAGAASADVTLAGSGYFGLAYDQKNKDTSGTDNAQLIDRLQIDIKASKTTDSGLTFHGMFRIRSNAYQASGTTPVNAGQVGVTAGGFDVTVGNVSDAIDAMSLFYNSEIGLCGCGGETLWGWEHKDYSSTGAGNNGVLATYTMGSLIVRGSWQTISNMSSEKGEGAISVFDKFGNLSLEAGYMQRDWSAGNSGYTGYTLVAEYALGNSNVGVAYGRNTDTDTTGVKAKGVGITTLYGNTKFGATTVQAFVSSATGLASTINKTTYGVGASYDLGSGASLVGSIRRDNGLNSAAAKDTYADLGVKFAF